MDNLTRLIAEYSASLSFDELPDEVVHAARRFMVDSLACGLAAYDCEPARIGLRLAEGALPERYPGRAMAYPVRSTAEAATFINTSLIRNLDFNDQYPGGHPSDCLGALLAMAESDGVDGKRMVTSLVVAYELFVRISDATKLRYKGWDQGYAIGISTATAIGNLLGLPADAIGEGVAITAVANVPMRNTRAGHLTEWKGAATAYAARNGVFGALLAAEGMTGPDLPFEGKHGLWDLLTGPFEFEPFGGRGGPFRTPDVQLKYWPVEYNAQLVVWAALDLRSRADWRELEQVDIGVYTFAYTEIGSEPEKWDPKTRETADHSLPYIFARTLVDGTVDASTFEPSAYLDPSIRPLMSKIRVNLDPERDAIYPERVSLTVAARTSKGERIEFEKRDPLGHNKNPMQDQDVRDKFLRAATPLLGDSRAAQALETWWELERLPGFSRAMDLLEVKPTADRGR